MRSVIILEAVKSDGRVLGMGICKPFQNDREIVLKAVKNNENALFYASHQLRGDREIVKEAVSKKG